MPTLVKTAQSEAPERLESWKEIAAYLNCGERTAKRWEKTRNLPIRRLPGGPGQVFAYRSEVSAWRESNSQTDLADDSPSESEPTAASAGLPEASTDVSASANTFAAQAATQPRRFPWLWASAGVLAAALLLFFGLRSLRNSRHPQLLTANSGSAHVPPQKARDLYLEGRFYWNKRTPADLVLATRDFQGAILLDSQYAAPYAGLADAYGLSTEFAAMPPQTAYPKMLDAARRAIALDPGLPEGHRALGFALFYWNWDLAGSRREFDQAIVLNAHDATTYHWYANILQEVGDLQVALSMIDKAQDLDPTSRSILADRGLIDGGLGHLPQAVRKWEDLEHSDPNYLPPHWYLLGFALEHAEPADALKEMRSIAAITHAPSDLERVTRCEAGNQHNGMAGLLNADADFEVSLAQTQHADFYTTAVALDLANRDPEALQYLQLAYRQRDPQIPMLPDMRHFESLEGNPVFEDLKRRSRLPYSAT